MLQSFPWGPYVCTGGVVEGGRQTGEEVGLVWFPVSLPPPLLLSLPHTVCLENDSQECSKILMDGKAELQYPENLSRVGRRGWAEGPERPMIRGSLCLPRSGDRGPGRTRI